MMNLKKIGALVLTLAMIALAGAAYASSVEALENGVVDSEHNTTTTAENTILLLKELVIHNTDGNAIYLPNVTYTYTIAEAAEADGVGTTIGDAQTPQVTSEVFADNTTTNGRALQTTSATVQSVEFTRRARRPRLPSRSRLRQPVLPSTRESRSVSNPPILIMPVFTATRSRSRQQTAPPPV